ncbi:hypothetical protein ACFXMT_33765 [Streptomyces mirabilis]|uniref:hypothetical protein n=1 Tax=Streptomyces mirabilis TaxID=68239 RepID=UPI00368C77D2
MRALLEAPGLDGAIDAVRLATVVLTARTPSTTGRVEIRSGELGRWLGMSTSYVASVVVPGLRRSGVVEIATVQGEAGEDRGLECKVLPLWGARGRTGHPLALEKKEFATLLRLLEAVMAPGWVHRDGSVTPAGLLGSRTGRGAATDRLALLLLVLEATETGRVRQCGGLVDTKRGRAAATVARLLGCRASAGERVLERLEERGLVRRIRLRTASGLAHRSRLMVPAVTAAHGRGGVANGEEDRARAVDPYLSEPDVAAGRIDAPGAAADSQVSGVQEEVGAEMAEPDVPIALHTDHASVASESCGVAVAGGFSGEGRGGDRSRPERACTGGDQAPGSVAGDQLPASSGEGGPLRGEQPKESPAAEVGVQAEVAAASRARLTVVDGGRQQQGRGVADLPDLRLRVALAPVSWLWSQLSRGQQKVAGRAVSQALDVLEGMSSPEAAPQLLANRLTGRLQEVRGEALVREPMGWLLRRGLVQRQACSDRRCDDGSRLDTGADCENCANVLHIRRAWRARITAEVDAAMPGADPTERKAAIEERLRHRAELEAEDLMRSRQQAEAERARCQAVRAAAEARVQAEREAAAAAEAARQARPCADCGTARSAGLCETCGYQRQTQALVEETMLVAAAGAAGIGDVADVQAVTENVRGQMEREIAAARQQLLDLINTDDAVHNTPEQLTSALAFTALQAVRQAADKYRSSTLRFLASSPQAQTEAELANTAKLRKRRHHWNPDGETTRTAARDATDAARGRTAQYLLDTRLQQLRATAEAATSKATEADVPKPRGRWAERLAPLAALPISDDPVRVVT